MLVHCHIRRVQYILEIPTYVSMSEHPGTKKEREEMEKKREVGGDIEEENEVMVEKKRVGGNKE